MVVTPLTSLLLVALATTCVAATAEQAEAALPYALGKPTFFGSGCPVDSVAVVASSDAKTISVLFSKFASATTASQLRQRKACNLAVPLDLQPGFTVAVTQVDYRGNVFVPNDVGSHADFSTEYFLTGGESPTSTRLFGPGFNDDITLSDAVTTVAWAPCGASTILRVNANVVAQKTAPGNGDVQIAVDSADGRLGGFYYSVQSKRC